MAIKNKNLFPQTSISYGIKGVSSNQPLTTSDDIAVEILADEDGDYVGFKSLSEVVTDLITVVKGSQTGEDTTEAIDSLSEVYNFLTEYKNSEVLKETEEVSEESIKSLFISNEDEIENKD